MERPSEVLRNAIDEAGVCRAEVARRAGITEATMSRFMAGNQIRSAAFDALCGALGLKLTKRRSRK